jgi:ecotin
VISVPTTPAAEDDLRVELVVGRTLLVDCNRHLLQGSVAEESVPGWGYPLYRVKGGSPLVSTRMACPDQAPRKEFVRLAGPPRLVPVNSRLPIVVVAPKDLEVRWRLWRADPRQRPARLF